MAALTGPCVPVKVEPGLGLSVKSVTSSRNDLTHVARAHAGPVSRPASPLSRFQRRTDRRWIRLRSSHRARVSLRAREQAWVNCTDWEMFMQS